LINRWSLSSDVRRTAPDALEARVFVPEDSIWFSGHFPGEPILPGIAVVHAVYETIQQDAQCRGTSVHISHLKRIRFTSPVRPGDTLLIRITSEVASTEMHYIFKATVGENTVSSGLVVVTKI
jgi:3-hydroxymyristoyl/3-hydroxydecanoyl-(acyl carrier protein) dehydratase